jgi:crotonobetaine/carnitine-CoA ligase
LTNRLARGFIELGLEPGERVACLLDNGLDATMVWLAANKARAVHVPLNTGLDEVVIREQLANCLPSLVITEAAHAEMLGRVLAALGHQPAVVFRSDLDQHFDPDSTALNLPHDVFDLASIVYTSGTTGAPKGCMISHNYHCSMARELIVARGRLPEDVVWTPQPNFHMEAMSTVVVQTLLLGGTAAIGARFDAKNFWTEVERTRTTVVAMLNGGPALHAIAEQPTEPAAERCRGRLRQVIAPATPEIARVWRDRFGVSEVGMNRGYGSTETSMVTITPHGEAPPPGASGHRIPMIDVRVVDDQDRELPVGEIGEIVWRPRVPGVMFDGYWGRPDLTQAASRNWWFHGGDLGRLDAQGWLYYSGRRSDLIAGAGRDVTMFDVEVLLLRHPAILEAAVHHASSARAELKATVVLKPGAVLTPVALHDYARTVLPPAAVPRHVEIRLALPKNATGRVLKVKLRDEPLGAETWSAPI